MGNEIIAQVLGEGQVKLELSSKKFLLWMKFFMFLVLEKM